MPAVSELCLLFHRLSFGFYSLQLAANASFVKAAELLQRCSLVAHFERSLGSARLSKGSVGL